MNHSLAAVMKTRPRPGETDLAFDTTLDGATPRRDASRKSRGSTNADASRLQCVWIWSAHETRLSLRSRRRDRVRAVRHAAVARGVAAAEGRQRRRLQRSDELAERSRLRGRLELLVVRA